MVAASETVGNPKLKMRVPAKGRGWGGGASHGLGIEPTDEPVSWEPTGGESCKAVLALPGPLADRHGFWLADGNQHHADLITQSQIWNFLLEEVKPEDGLLGGEPPGNC